MSLDQQKAVSTATDSGGRAKPATKQRFTIDDIEALLTLPFGDLLYEAQRVHRAHHAPNGVQLSTLLSIKTGGCPEDCAYCPQAARYHTGVSNEMLKDVAEVVAIAPAAKAAGRTRFCMGAAWRGPKDREVALKEAGLDYYNHNLDTAPEFYGQIVSTRVYQDRLDTLSRVRDAGIAVCCGGIVGMGESRRQRAGLIAQLANLDPYPESVPINHLVQVEGTPLHDRFHGESVLDPLEFVRTIAAARITMPKAMVRLSAGRREFSDAIQALCFLAGANSIFYGDRLLTTGNPDIEADQALFAKLGIAAM
jgi:biotin synthase